MLNRLGAQLRNLTRPGETVVCAVSGGADSMALLWGAYLLKDTLGIRLEAAHFNHHLRAAESDRDEAFVREFCSRFEIPLTVGAGVVIAGEKAWKQPQGTQDTLSCGLCPAKSLRPTPPMTMPKPC